MNDTGIRRGQIWLGAWSPGSAVVALAKKGWVESLARIAEVSI